MEDNQHCKCVSCNGRSDDEMKMWEDRCLNEYGFYTHLVPDDDITPHNLNAHTHGLNPDFQIVVPIDPDSINGVFHAIKERLDEGVVFEPGKQYAGVLAEPYVVEFAWAREAARDVLRVILPDKGNNTNREDMHPDWATQWEGTANERLC